MAKYDVHYSCGHDGQVELYGKTSERYRKIEWMEKGICPECYAAKQAAEKAAKLEAAKATTADLPALIGSEKQIAWATEIRARIMADKAMTMAAVKPEAVELATGIVAAIEGNTLAGWWIDHKDYSLRNLIKEAHRAANAQ